MKKLEEIRLEVDSRRRTVADLSAKVEKQRARLPQTRAKGEDEMQNTIKTMQHKENKLAGGHDPLPCLALVIGQWPTLTAGTCCVHLSVPCTMKQGQGA